MEYPDPIIISSDEEDNSEKLPSCPQKSPSPKAKAPQKHNSSRHFQAKIPLPTAILSASTTRPRPKSAEFEPQNSHQLTDITRPTSAPHSIPPKSNHTSYYSQEFQTDFPPSSRKILLRNPFPIAETATTITATDASSQKQLLLTAPICPTMTSPKSNTPKPTPISIPTKQEAIITTPTLIPNPNTSFQTHEVTIPTRSQHNEKKANNEKVIIIIDETSVDAETEAQNSRGITNKAKASSNSIGMSQQHPPPKPQPPSTNPNPNPFYHHHNHQPSAHPPPSNPPPIPPSRPPIPLSQLDPRLHPNPKTASRAPYLPLPTQPSSPSSSSRKKRLLPPPSQTKPPRPSKKRLNPFAQPQPRTPRPKSGPRPRSWPPTLLSDLSLSLQSAFDFQAFATKHRRSAPEVFELFTKVVHVPIMEYCCSGALAGTGKRGRAAAAGGTGMKTAKMREEGLDAGLGPGLGLGLLGSDAWVDEVEEGSTTASTTVPIFGGYGQGRYIPGLSSNSSEQDPPPHQHPYQSEIERDTTTTALAVAANGTGTCSATASGIGITSGSSGAGGRRNKFLTEGRGRGQAGYEGKLVLGEDGIYVWE